MCLLCEASLPFVSHQLFASSELFYLHLEQEHRVTFNQATLLELSLGQVHQSTRLRPHLGQRRKEETLLVETEYWPKARPTLPPNPTPSGSSPPYCLTAGDDFSLEEGEKTHDRCDQEVVLHLEDLEVVEVIEGSKPSLSQDGLVSSKIPVVRMVIFSLVFVVLLVVLLGSDFWWPEGFHIGYLPAIQAISLEPVFAGLFVLLLVCVFVCCFACSTNGCALRR